MKNLLNLKSRMLFVAFLLTLTAAALAEQIVIVDGGSSKSQLFMYDVDGGKAELVEPTPAFPDFALSKLATTDGAKINGFVGEVAKFCIGAKKDTKLYILATAGMRMVDQDKATTLYNTLNGKTYGNCKLVTAMTISGRYEGLYAWLATGVEKGHLGISGGVLTYHGTPFGIIEIGGASIQQTYPKNSTCTDCIQRMGTANIYSKSYLGWGASEIITSSEKNYSSKQSYHPSNPNLDNGKYYKLGNGFKNTEYANWLIKGKSITLDTSLFDTGSINWTKGAAIDIMINKELPKPFTNPKDDIK